MQGNTKRIKNKDEWHKKIQYINLLHNSEGGNDQKLGLQLKTQGNNRRQKKPPLRRGGVEREVKGIRWWQRRLHRSVL